MLQAVVYAGTMLTMAATINAAGADRSLIVQIRSRARLAPIALHQALDEVARIFRHIGISITWVDGTDPAATPRLLLTVLDRELSELARPDRVLLGAAPRTAEAAGRMAYVFFQPIEHLSDLHGVDVVLVLAHAIAHEIGHLLLPAGHALEGLMYGQWGPRQVRAAAWGQLLFSREEIDVMRAALAPDPPVVARR